MNKHALKFLLGAAGIVLLGFGVLYVLPFFSPEYKQEQATIKKLKEIQDQYMQDTYGGNTPEETIQLFIDAFKKGDIDLAVKYFVLDKQERQQEKLRVIKEKNLWSAMLKELESLEKPYVVGKGENVIFVFEAYDNEKQLVLQPTVIKGPNGKWKIEDM